MRYANYDMVFNDRAGWDAAEWTAFLVTKSADDLAELAGKWQAGYYDNHPFMKIECGAAVNVVLPAWINAVMFVQEMEL